VNFKSAMGDSKPTLPNDVARGIYDLRDKFKHGHHVIKILESQLETARQNISLLQGQIRLANETIENLKQQFNEADMTLAYMTDNYKGNHERRHDLGRQSGREADDYTQAPVFVARNDEQENQRRLLEFERNSQKSLPKSNDMGTLENGQHERTKTPTQHVQERPKSPYAQQLRQVLDALQDEDPRKSLISHESQGISSQPQLCTCAECVSGSTGHRHYQPAESLSRHSSCGYEYNSSEMHYHDDCNKHKSVLRTSEESSVLNRPGSAHPIHHDGTPSAHISNVNHSSHQIDYSSQCTGPCCSSIDLSKGYKIVEKSPGMPHYIAPRSPRRQKPHEARHDPHCHQVMGHCEDDKCHCHAYVSYAPFGYQVVESSPGVPRSIQPISPSLLGKKSKRYMPLAPGDEPPHLKYTKVKRIDGSKVAAQKTIQDFSKRRLQPYNPRWDLDLLIVPPPMPASELFSALGLEQESNIKRSRDRGSDASISGDSLPIESKNHEGPMIKSKVINSGGTVIVLTESDQQQRSAGGHSILSMTQVESPGSLVNESSYGNEMTRPLPSGMKKVGSECHDFKLENRLGDVAEEEYDDDDEVDGEEGKADTHGSLMEHADHQTQNAGPPNLGNPMPTEDFVSVNAHSSTSPRSAYKISKSSSLESVQQSHESALKAKVSFQVNLKTERNNNSLGSRQMGNSMTSNDRGAEQIETVVIDSANNLSSRYENILFQKNQDYGRLPNDEEYILHSRAKGKVH